MSDIRYFNFHNCLVGICRDDDPADVDEAYGEGTYDSLFPDDETEIEG